MREVCTTTAAVDSIQYIFFPFFYLIIFLSPLVDRDGTYRVLGSTSNNTLEVFRVTVPAKQSQQREYSLEKTSVLEMHGHRSDVRGVCISSDGSQIASVSNEGVKVWSTKTYACVRSCATGYGVSMAYVTGNRYIIVGTKEGKIQV